MDKCSLYPPAPGGLYQRNPGKFTREIHQHIFEHNCRIILPYCFAILEKARPRDYPLYDALPVLRYKQLAEGIESDFAAANKFRAELKKQVIEQCRLPDIVFSDLQQSNNSGLALSIRLRPIIPER